MFDVPTVCTALMVCAHALNSSLVSTSVTPSKVVDAACLVESPVTIPSAAFSWGELDGVAFVGRLMTATRW